MTDQVTDQPTNQPKQETLEEAAERHKWGLPVKNFIRGAQWQSERMYSEDDMISFMQFIISQESLENTSGVSVTTAKYYLEKFLKKRNHEIK